MPNNSDKIKALREKLKNKLRKKLPPNSKSKLTPKWQAIPQPITKEYRARVAEKLDIINGAVKYTPHLHKRLFT